ncbi:unnamed protein product [Protopolystoma xenopodis]|uniref:Uncharacterized protein n=1 Tax=Protopolystoma xenopodis TaxID=117903 RepID=A0A448XGM1_9PLAT|nr:unnamed protein product [Protopolystoma xenopodis]
MAPSIILINRLSVNLVRFMHFLGKSGHSRALSESYYRRQSRRRHLDAAIDEPDIRTRFSLSAGSQVQYQPVYSSRSGGNLQPAPASQSSAVLPQHQTLLPPPQPPVPTFGSLDSAQLFVSQAYSFLLVGRKLLCPNLQSYLHSERMKKNGVSKNVSIVYLEEAIGWKDPKEDDKSVLTSLSQLGLVVGPT